MYNIPLDVVREIAQWCPDSRPFLLTCQAYYEIFCELPDVAYWCSGKDLRWLLPKMIPDVWNGYLIEIIHADNADVFAHVHTRAGAPANISMLACRYYIDNHMSRNIARYLHTTYGIHMRAMEPPPHPPHKRGDIGGGGGTVADLDRIVALEGLNRLGHWIGWQMTYMHIRTYPLPPPEFEHVIMWSGIDDIKNYLRAYKKTVTILMVLKMRESRCSSVLRWLYTEAVRIYGCEIPFLLWDIKVRADSADDVRFFADRGVDILPATFPGYVPLEDGLRELYIERFRDDMVEIARNGICSKPEKFTKLCAKHGIKVSMTEATMDGTGEWSEMLFIIRTDPKLARTDRFMDWIHDWVCRYDPTIAQQVVADLRTIPDAASVAAKVTSVFNCEK